MSKTIDDKDAGTPRVGSDEAEVEQPNGPTRKRLVSGGSRRAAIVAIVAVIAIAAMAIVAWIYWRSGSTGAGRPVPTPRSVSSQQMKTTVSQATEPTLSLEPEAAARAGIKTETVGEALVTGSSMAGPVTTGVVQANAYRTT